MKALLAAVLVFVAASAFAQFQVKEEVLMQRSVNWLKMKELVLANRIADPRPKEMRLEVRFDKDEDAVTKSDILQKLRSYPGVVIVEKNCDHRFDFLVTRMNDSLFICSTMILDGDHEWTSEWGMGQSLLQMLRAQNPTDPDAAFFERQMRDLPETYFPTVHFVTVGKTPLESIQKSVAEIDTSMLEGTRLGAQAQRDADKQELETIRRVLEKKGVAASK